MARKAKGGRKKTAKKAGRRQPPPAASAVATAPPPIDTSTGAEDDDPYEDDEREAIDDQGVPMDAPEPLDEETEVVEILRSLPGEVLAKVLVASGYQPPPGVQIADPDTEHESPQGELEKFWELVDGLPPGAQEAVAFTVYRVWPPRHPVTKDKMIGHCGTYRHRMDVDDIRDDYGRGDYDITMSFGNENAGQYKSLVKSRRISIASGAYMVPDPTPEAEVEADKVSEKILERLEHLEERLKAKSTEERGDKILDQVLPLMIEKLANPPAPPPQLDPIESLGKLLGVLERLQSKKDEPEMDPDSAAARVRQLRDLIHEGGELFKTMSEPGPAETTTTETQQGDTAGQAAQNQEGEDMMSQEEGRQILASTVEYYWTLLEANPNRPASSYAKDVRAFIAKEAGDKWVETLIEEITIQRAVEWLGEYATSQARRDIMGRRRWQEKVEKTVGLLRGDISKSDADGKGENV